jgi:hypothetical protein
MKTKSSPYPLRPQEVVLARNPRVEISLLPLCLFLLPIFFSVSLKATFRKTLASKNKLLGIYEINYHAFFN